MDIKIEITGKIPLLQHNIRLANPMDPATKALAAAVSAYKKDKTDASFQLASRLEWEGGLYHRPDIGVYIPSSWISGSLIRGGVKYGRHGTAVKESLLLQEVDIPLRHDGPTNLDEMWSDIRFRDVRAAGVGKQKVQRTRPKFDVWQVVALADLDESMLDLAVLRSIADKAGSLVGMGDYRPTFGRYTVQITEA